MTDYANTKGLNASLAKPADWNDWNHEFLIQADIYRLQGHVTHRRLLRQEPQMPDIRMRKYTKTVAAARGAVSQTMTDEGDELEEARDGHVFNTHVY
jgi:hypothetical protein